MLERAQNILPITALSISGFAGMLHGTWVFALVGACLLFLFSLIRRQFVPHMYPADHQVVPSATIVISSLGNASGVSAAAFALGRVTAMAWGI